MSLVIQHRAYIAKWRLQDVCNSLRTSHPLYERARLALDATLDLIDGIEKCQRAPTADGSAVKDGEPVPDQPAASPYSAAPTGRLNPMPHRLGPWYWNGKEWWWSPSSGTATKPSSETIASP
jgi:hypothetical protein